MSTTATIQVNVPSALLEIVECRDSGFVLHAPVDCRMDQALLIRAAIMAMEGRSVVLVGQLGHNAQLLLRDLTQGARSVKTGEATTYQYAQGRFTLFKHSFVASKDDDLMFISAPEERPLDFKTLFVASTMPEDNDHWIFNLSGRSFELPYSVVKREFANIPDPVLSGALFDRSYELDRTINIGGGTPFSVFARQRLRIRSDRPIHRLSEAQRLLAEERVGVPILPFYISALQQRYLAAKRRAVAQGKKPWFILLKYRRGGFTTIEQGLHYQFAVSRPYSQLATFAHTGSSSGRIFRIAALMHEHDPLRRPLVSDSKQFLEFDNGSAIFVGTAGGQGPSRGDTLQRVHGSEVSKWCEGPNQIRDVTDLMAGILGAASNGEVVLESTPNGREWFCHHYEEAKRGENDFTPIFLRWFDDQTNRMKPGSFDEEEIIDTLTEREAELIKEHQLDAAQIAFRRDAKRTYTTLFPQEMPEDDTECFLTSGQTYFDVDILSALLKTTKQPIVSHTHRGALEEIWEHPEPGIRYVMGIDTSEGIKGGDPNGIGVLRFDTMEQVYSLHGLMSPPHLAEEIKRVSLLYNGALFGVERENHGHAVLNHLVTLDYARPHYHGGPMFYHTKSGNRGNAMGWTTSPRTRPIMIDGLNEAFQTHSLVANDRRFLQECLTFRRQSSGKIEHDPGEHDDSVMKWAIAVQMRTVRVAAPGVTILGD